MITMGGFSLPSRTIREMICASVDVVIQAARLRDGSRRITHITEVMGLEGDVIITQDLFLYEIKGEDENGHIIGRHRSTGIGRPRFWDRARYYGEEKRLAAALDAAERRGCVMNRPADDCISSSSASPSAASLGYSSIRPSPGKRRSNSARRASRERSQRPSAHVARARNRAGMSSRAR